VRSNPFTYGNPIRDPSRFFGRTREVEQIFGRLRNKEFESSSVVGDRRIGKTSLLNYLADPGVRMAHGLDPEHYHFIYVDLQMVDKAMGPEELWHQLLSLMRKHCAEHGIAGVEAALEGHEILNTFYLDKVFREIDDKGQYVVFLLDEFEHVTTNPNFGLDFYYGLRALIIHHRVALVTSSRLELIELCHSEAVKASPFFNVFANINLRLFSDDDFKLLVSRSLSGTGIRFSEPETQQVLDLAGLHPYFLQAACCMLYESHQMGLDMAGRSAFLADRFRAEAIPHIVDYWDNSGDYQKIVLTAAALLERTARPVREFSLEDLQGVFHRAEPCVEHLEKRGLLMSRDARYRLFSSVFGPWILRQIVAEVSEEQSYRDWLADNKASVERITGRQGGPLRDILPKIGTRYRQLIITWASDPQNLAAMAGLLKNVLALIN
jgi:AAA-like domain